MKKHNHSLVKLACISAVLLSASNVASADAAIPTSSVQLYGVLSVGIMYTNNVGGHSQTQMLDNDHWANAIGFRGREDLGGGLAAIFTLETNFRLSSGATSGGGGCTQLFCKSYVGLSDRRYGTLTLGRQIDFTLDMLRYTGAGYTNELAFHPGGFDRQPIIGVNNSMKYESPMLWDRVQFKAMYALPQTPATGQNQTGRTLSFALKYSDGPFSAAAVTTMISDTVIKPWNTIGGLGLPAGEFWGVVGAPNTSTVVPLSGQNIYGIGADYKFSKVTVFGSFTDTHMVSQSGTYNGSVRNIDFGASYLLMPDLSATLAYWNSKFPAANATWNNVNAALDYFFSKRTDVYAIASYQHVSGTPHAQNYFMGPSSGASQVGFGMGIRHYF